MRCTVARENTLCTEARKNSHITVQSKVYVSQVFASTLNSHSVLLSFCPSVCAQNLIMILCYGDIMILWYLGIVIL